MGHRALVAYQVDPGRYDVYYSHWGAARLKLKHLITADEPYGDGAVREDPIDGGTGVTLETIKDDLLQYGSHEALFIVSESFEVTAWGVEEYTFGRYYQTGRRSDAYDDLPDTEGRSRGVCYPVRWHDGEPVSFLADRGRIRGYLESVATMLETDRMDDLEDAITFVHGRVRRRFLPSKGGHNRYDEPLISSEESVPMQLKADTRSMSELMTDGGTTESAQQSLGDY